VQPLSTNPSRTWMELATPRNPLSHPAVIPVPVPTSTR
jgi:hypothetical protein